MNNKQNKRLRRRVRTAYFISTVSIALVLFLLGTVGYLMLNALSATDRMKESVTVNVMLREGTTPGLRDSIGADLRRFPAVRTARFVDRKEAAGEFKEYVGSDFEGFLGENPLPDSYRVGLHAKGSVKDSLAALEKTILSWKGVDEVVYQRGVVEQITANINKFLLVILFFGGTLLVISVVLLRNTIRAAIYSRRYVINTMKLVGATRWFILRPFLGEAILQGLYAGLIAALMFAGMIFGLQEGLPEMKLMLANTHLIVILCSMFAGGVLISLTFTLFAVNKFINMKTSQIHMF